VAPVGATEQTRRSSSPSRSVAPVSFEPHFIARLIEENPERLRASVNALLAQRGVA
jgi:hypothetical protein